MEVAVTVVVHPEVAIDVAEHPEHGPCVRLTTGGHGVPVVAEMLCFTPDEATRIAHELLVAAEQAQVPAHRRRRLVAMPEVVDDADT